MNIALVAHDGRKAEMIEWVTYRIIDSGLLFRPLKCNVL